MRTDIAIIGSGPAGISAAITAKARNKSILLFGGGGISEKIGKAHLIRNYPGLPEISGAELEKAYSRHLAAMGLTITQEQVIAVYDMGDRFTLQTTAGMYESETVILATGAVLGKPLIGEIEFLGKGVSYCATCDAFLYKGKTVAVLGYNDEAVSEAEFLAETCQKVLYLPLKKKTGSKRDNIEVIPDKPLEIIGDKKVTTLRTDKGDIAVDGIFILRNAVAPDKLVPGLETNGAHIAVNAQMATNINGCFACGDAVGTPYQYIKATGQGNIAALSAVSYISEKKKGE